MRFGFFAVLFASAALLASAVPLPKGDHVAAHAHHQEQADHHLQQAEHHLDQATNHLDRADAARAR
ncbi:hypothetical protein SIIN_5282_T [Serendipita indica DSM 11827]|nr:hypothetical protein SIIN_5282_T [Serendipita indica DSM 11827]